MMGPRKLAFIVACTTGVAVSACGSSTSGGQACSITDSSSATFTRVTKAASSGAVCPDIPVADLNASSGDSGSSGACAPKVSASGCSMTMDCDVGGGRLTGTFTVSGSVLSGSFSVAVSGTTCTYSVEGKVR
jgi:hypothetical protein